MRAGIVIGHGFLALVLLFLYVPLILMFLMSVNKSPFYQFPIEFDLVWYARLLRNERLLRAGWNSIALAAANTVIATALGTLAAFGMRRLTVRGRNVLQLLLLPVITIPWLILGTAMLIFFFWTGIGRGLHAMLLGHVALSLPYVIFVVGARAAALDPALEEAAASLGANPWTRARRITLPLLAPGVLAAALFAFAVSFDQFVISYFLAAPGMATLPVEIYTAIRTGFTPEINAISSIVFVVSVTVLLAFVRLSRIGERLS